MGESDLEGCSGGGHRLGKAAYEILEKISIIQLGCPI